MAVLVLQLGRQVPFSGEVASEGGLVCAVHCALRAAGVELSEAPGPPGPGRCSWSVDSGLCDLSVAIPTLGSTARVALGSDHSRSSRLSWEIVVTINHSSFDSV